ncbi:MAG: GNAT family N-acetyltransferase [Lewinella sp.]|nr:GNAT family N-acetyltransferase [Lewinella sp.]
MADLTYSCKRFSELSREELYELLALRQAVFVVEQHCPYLDADGQDQAAYHVLGRDTAGRLATYTRLLPPGTAYPDYAAIGRVITADFARGLGYGRPLMEISIQYCHERFGEVGIKLSAQAHLRGYYHSLGFEAYGPYYFEDGIPHIGMTLKKQ